MLQTDKTKWCYMYDTDDGNDGTLSDVFDSFDEALNAAIKDLKLELGDTTWIGHPSYYIPVVDAENVITDIAYDAMKETYNWSQDSGYLEDVTKEHRRGLQMQLTEVFRLWERQNGYTCKAFVVKDAKEYTVDKSHKEFWSTMFDSLDKTTDEEWKRFVCKYDTWEERLRMNTLKKSLKIGDRIIFRRRHLPNYTENYKGVINSYLDRRFNSYEVKLENGDIMDYFINGDILLEVSVSRRVI